MARPTTSSIRLYLVRHGRAAATFAEADDPGLDAAGVAQAEAVAARLAPLGPLPIAVSPLRRTRESAAPLERLWGRAGRVEPAVAEIPSPGVPLAGRSAWLQAIMAGRWPDLDPGLRAWRGRLISALVTIPEPTVVVTHFIAINVAVGHALGDERVVCFEPDHCSVTTLDARDGGLRLVERGKERATEVG